jgi:signal transduction histidine kinase/ligand-binding sensor domain-containing protein
MVALVLVLSVAGASLSERTAAGPFTHFSLDSWSVSSGALPSAVRAITQTADGYLWVLTSNGPLKFDGLRFTASPELKDAVGPPIVRTTAMLRGRDGTLWLAGADFLVGLKNGRSQVYQHTLVASCLAEASDGTLWIGHGNRGLTRFREGRFEDLAVPMPNVSALHVDAHGILWIGSWGDGLFRMERGGVVRVAPPLDTHVHGMASDPAGNLWMATRRGLTSISGAARADRLRADVTAIATTQEGDVWAGTSDGTLHHLRGGRLQSLAPRSPGQGPILSLYEDREGSLWIASTDGLLRLKPGPFTTYGTHEGLVHNEASSVIEARDGAIWVFSDGGGLSRIKDGAITHVTEREGLPSNYGGPLFEDREGSLWAGTARGLARLRGGRVVSYRTGRLSGFVSALFEDSEGLIVATTAGTLNSLERFQDGRLSAYRPRGARIRPDVYVYQARRMPDGTNWLATSQGLIRIRGGWSRVFTMADGLRADNVRTVQEDSEGVLWLATAGVGIVRLQQETVVPITTQQGLYDDRVFCVLPGDDGHLWMSSQRGLFRVSRDDAERVAAGQADRVRSIPYDVSDGLPTTEFSVGTQQPCWKSRGGLLWFATRRGVVAVDTRHVRKNPLAPPVVIEGVRLDGRDGRAEEAVVVPAGARRVEFFFTGLSLLVPHRVQFRYRLHGFEKEWVHDNRRSASYMDLPPGRYRFQVVASNNDGVWNDTGASIALEVRPFFYQTLLFRALVVAALVALAAAAHRWHLAGMRRRYQAVVEERTRIAREMHDTLAQNLGGVALMIEAIDVHDDGGEGGAPRQLEEASRLLRYNLAEAYRAIRDLRTDALETRDLWTSMSAVLERATSDSGLSFQLHGGAGGVSLSPQAREGLLRIVQESVANVVRHAQAHTIDVELARSDGRLRVVVSDDGRGFDTNGAFSLEARHYGLIGMRERAERLGGRLEVTSSVGKGTRVLVEVPAP